MNKQRYIIKYSPHLIPVPLVFTQSPLSAPGLTQDTTVYVQSSHLLRLLLAMTGPQTSLHVSDLDGFEELLRRCFLECFSAGLYLKVFSHDEAKVLGFGKKTPEVKCQPYHIMSRILQSAWLISVILTLTPG